MYNCLAEFVYIIRAKETIVVNNNETVVLYDRIISKVINRPWKRGYFVV